MFRVYHQESQKDNLLSFELETWNLKLEPSFNSPLSPPIQASLPFLFPLRVRHDI